MEEWRSVVIVVLLVVVCSLSVEGGCCPRNPCTASAPVDPSSMSIPPLGFGGIEVRQNGPYQDVYLLSPSKQFSLALRLNWGGSVVFFGFDANPASNVIDAHDTGRELQLSLYDPDRAHQPCACSASCQTHPATCGDSIAYMGWNPVQGGDDCGRGAKVLGYGRYGNGLQLIAQPMQWNADWNQCSCLQSGCSGPGAPVNLHYTFTITFIQETVVDILTQAVSLESYNHAATEQEFPCLYVSHGQFNTPDLSHLYDANYNAINITVGPNGMACSAFNTPKPFAVYEPASGSYGVGMMADQGLTQFEVCRGDGINYPYFHYLRPLNNFAVSAQTTISGRTYLALGNFPTINSSFVNQVLNVRPPFGSLDVPAYGANGQVKYTAGQSIVIGGWALDTDAISQVYMALDGSNVGRLNYGAVRPDVCNSYPSYTNCPNVGYTGFLNTNGLGACAHLLQVVAQDVRGNPTVLGERVLIPV